MYYNTTIGKELLIENMLVLVCMCIYYNILWIFIYYLTMNTNCVS